MRGRQRTSIFDPTNGSRPLGLSRVGEFVRDQEHKIRTLRLRKMTRRYPALPNEPAQSAGSRTSRVQRRRWPRFATEITCAQENRSGLLLPPRILPRQDVRAGHSSRKSKFLFRLTTFRAEVARGKPRYSHAGI